MGPDDQGVFVCAGCSQELLRVESGEQRVALAMNLGWGPLEFCCDCVGFREPKAVVEQMLAAMFPKQERGGAESD